MTSQNKLKPEENTFAKLGKMPPHAIDVEETVLGIILNVSGNYMLAKDILKPNSFYKDEHKLIFEAMGNVAVKDLTIDIMTVTVELRKMGKLDFVGGPFYVSELASNIMSTANIEYHCVIVQQKFIARQLIEQCQKIVEDAYNDVDVFDLLDSSQNAMAMLVNFKQAKQAQTLHEAAQQLHDESTVERITDIGVPTGFAAHDKEMGHLIPGELIILAARPGMGKTSQAMGIGKSAAKKFKKPTLVFSLEMSNQQLAARLLSPDVHVSADKLLNGRATKEVWWQVNEGLNKYKDIPLYFDDTAEMSITDLVAKSKRYVALYGVELIIIDYLQLLSGTTEGKKGELSREQEISRISRGLKKLAKTLNIPVIALSQLSRAVEERKDKRPMLSDLRESGSIEQDADRVWFLYRPEYYGEKQATVFGQKIDSAGVAEWIIAKNRNGTPGTIFLDFEAQYTAFGDWIPGYSDQRAQRASEQRLRKTGEQLAAGFVEDDDSLPF